MKKIITYIQEKLIINKDSKSSITILDLSNENMLMDMLRATFISIMKNSSYKLRGLSTYVIKRNDVKYDDIINILNEYYHYNFNINDIKDKNNLLYQTLHNFLDPLDKLLNMKKIKVKGFSNIVDGSKIYFNDWVIYRNTKLKR